MKKHCIYLAVFTTVFLVMVACAKQQAPPTIYSGLKSEISAEARELNSGGLALAKKGSYREAIREYKKAVAKEPSYTDAYVNLSRAYYAVGDYDMARFYNLKAKETLDAKATVIRESEMEQEEKF